MKIIIYVNLDTGEIENEKEHILKKEKEVQDMIDTCFDSYLFNKYLKENYTPSELLKADLAFIIEQYKQYLLNDYDKDFCWIKSVLEL